jgi:hypothetical protein
MHPLHAREEAEQLIAPGIPLGSRRGTAWAIVVAAAGGLRPPATVSGRPHGLQSPPEAWWRCRPCRGARCGQCGWLCSGHRPERSAWLGSYDRVLLTPARCADLPPTARAAGQTGRGERANERRNAPAADGQ